jgi:hypothetical protein
LVQPAIASATSDQTREQHGALRVAEDQDYSTVRKKYASIAGAQMFPPGPKWPAALWQ